MGTLLEAAATGEGRVAAFSKHKEGVPDDCDALVDAWTTNLTDVTATPLGSRWAGTTDVNGDVVTAGNLSYGFDVSRGPSGGIYGAASIINVTDGTMFSYNATAIDAFYAKGTTDKHTSPGSLSPSLSEGTNNESNVFVAGTVATHTWSAPLYALNATITHNKLMNEYVFGGPADARTEWIVTFPTKRFHVDVQKMNNVTANNPIAPFTNTWHIGTSALNYACEDLQFVYFDREERPDDVAAPKPGSQGPIVSPPRPTPDAGKEEVELFQLCREANVVRFASSDEATLPAVAELTGEPSRSGTFPKLGYVNFGLPYSEGWVNMDLYNIDSDSTSAAYKAGVKVRQSVAATGGDKVNGLPVIGFAVSTYTNGNIGSGVLANYGGTFAHRATRAISS